MYGGKGGGVGICSNYGSGAIVLPNTGGNHLLMITSIVSIVVGGAILLSSFARIAAKRAYRG